MEPHANIYGALAAVNRDVDAIAKTQKNSQQNFNFRGIDDAYNTLHDVMAKHGIVTIPKVLSREVTERLSSNNKALFFTHLEVVYVFVHESGDSIEVGPIIGESMDSGDKGCNKALAVAHKYALFQTFTIPTLFTDPEGEVHEVESEANFATPEQVADIEKYKHLLPKVTQDWLAGIENVNAHQADTILAKISEAIAKQAQDEAAEAPQDAEEG